MSAAETVVEKPTLDALIRQVLRESPEAEPEGVVDTVIGMIDPLDMETYLRKAITSRLSSAMSWDRNKNTPDIRKGVSTKQSLIRDQYWPRFLEQRIFLPTGHKFLAQATSEDLRFVAGMRRTQAVELSMRADQFETLADLMDDSGTRVLGALDEKVGQAALVGAA